MYAAAGGASLASRQARQRQRQEKKTQQLQAKLHPPKASILSPAEHGASTPTRGRSRQFHQLPTNYLRTPQAQSRKLSASYTAQSKLLLPIDEGDTQSVLHMRMHTHATGAHGHAQQHSHSHAHTQQHVPPNLTGHQHHHFQPYAEETAEHLAAKLLHRHSGGSSASFQHVPLPKSATATLPLVSQTVEPTPPTSPAGAAGATADMTTPTTLMTTATIAVPHHDAIIVTPATPMASPGHVPRLRPPDDLDLPETADEKQPLTAASGADDESDEAMQPPHTPLERKCSVYRMRRSDAHEYQQDIGGMKRLFKELQFNQQHFQQQQEQLHQPHQQQQQLQQQQYEPLPIDEPQMVFKGLPSGRKWQICAYCEEGICVCEHIECAQGRAAWLERGRRCSVQETPPQAVVHRRWVKRNRIQDASLGGSSDDEDFLGVLRGPSTFANAFLYVGLGTIALGLVIAFVGTGEKGFKTVELRLIGPSLIGLGLICCILRILFCICPSHCISSKKKGRKKNGNKVDADHTTSLLRGENKRVSIARGHTSQPKYPITHRRSQSKMINEGMEALRQLATTSLFMQNEQKPALNRVVPLIKEPEQANVNANLEMKKLERAIHVSGEQGEEEKSATKPHQQQPAVTIAGIATESTIRVTAAKTTTTTKAKTKTTTIATTTTSSSRSIKPLRKQDTITSEADEVSTPCTINDNSVQQQQQLPLTTTTSGQKINTSDLLMQETSLMVIEPTTIKTEARPPSIVPLTTTTAATTTTTTMSTSASVPTHTGAISRIPNSLTSYELPPAKPHTYAAARSGDRGDPAPLIRGPLGMPLSALTASSSTYAMPSSSVYKKPAKSLPASSSAPGVANNCLYGATTTVATTATTMAHSANKVTFASQKQQQQLQQQPTHIPGQIVDTTTILKHRNSTVSAINNKTSSPSAPATTNMNVHVTSNAPTNGRVSSNNLTPPNTASKFEPELLLSPAKLGQ